MTTTNEPLGEVLRNAEHFGLRFVREFPHAPDKVWRAITESQHMAAWMACDMIGERRAGATIELRLWPAIVEKYGSDHAHLPGVINVWSPPHVFEWTWDQDVLRFELTETLRGTLLTFTTWFSEPDTPLTDAAAGYHVWLDALRDALGGNTSRPIAQRDPGPFERLYALPTQ